jgi:hypothetical protein
MDKIKLKTGNLAYKQHLEKNALKQKLDLQYEELKLKKNNEMDNIILKFKNKKKDLKIHHNSEMSIRSNINFLKKSILD